MQNPPLELPFLSNLGLMLTFKCTTACPHCVVEAGPHRTEEITLERATDWIQQARDYRGGQVVGLALTGGEPFYILDTLFQVVDFAARRGFLISVVTNAYWATSEEAALEMLGRLPGVQMISMSTDVYHQKTIPFENIRHLIHACRKLGRVYNIAVCTDDEENPQYLQILDALHALGERERIRPAITYPVGRAKNLAKNFKYRLGAEPPVSACTMAGSPIAFMDGRVLACIGPVVDLPPGHPLYLGSLSQEPLRVILDRAELNPVLHIIRVWGPYKLVSMLREMGLGAYLPQEYVSTCICDICHKLMSDERLLQALNRMLTDEKIQQYMAYARIFYLNETRMAELLGLDNESQARKQQQAPVV